MIIFAGWISHQKNYKNYSQAKTIRVKFGLMQPL